MSEKLRNFEQFEQYLINVREFTIKAPARDCKKDEEYIKEVLNVINSDRQ